MAAPTPTARQTPTGTRLDDGLSTKITFAAAPAVGFWERAVKTPSFDGGEPINTTTMFNSEYRTKAPPKLKENGEMTATVTWDPDILSTVGGASFIRTMINRRDTITASYPDGSTLAFYGYLRKFEPNEHKEKEAPEAAITVVVTNWDYVNQVEAGPVFTAAAGT